jgi:hypothetical protein
MSDQGYDFESDGWMHIEEADEEEDALELAKEAFHKAIEAGNLGAYYGLASLINDDTSDKKIDYLEKATGAGRLDAMWELYLISNEKIKKYGLISIVVDHQIVADAKGEFESLKEGLSTDEIEKGKLFKNQLIKDIESSGNTLGTGGNPYL